VRIRLNKVILKGYENQICKTLIARFRLKPSGLQFLLNRKRRAFEIFLKIISTSQQQSKFPISSFFFFFDKTKVFWSETMKKWKDKDEQKSGFICCSFSNGIQKNELAQIQKKPKKKQKTKTSNSRSQFSCKCHHHRRCPATMAVLMAAMVVRVVGR